MNTKLFVGSLPYNTTSDELNALFSQTGQVISATIISDKFTGRSKGFGFVEMASEEDAQKALALNGQDFKGRALVVNQARPQETISNNRFRGAYHSRDHKERHNGFTSAHRNTNKKRDARY